jgi:hypothetical protein
VKSATLFAREVMPHFRRASRPVKRVTAGGRRKAS